MKKKLPILIIIPHGGYKVPEELAGYEMVDQFDLFIHADSCANEIFGYDDVAAAKVDSIISRLFIDTDRPITAVPPAVPDGIIKSKTPYGKKVFKDEIFPDEIAIANLIKRYYTPFHDTIRKIIESGEIECVIDCHTMMPVGPVMAPDAGKPRPILSVEYIISNNDGLYETCPYDLAHNLVQCMKKSLDDEDESVATKFALSQDPSTSHIIKKFGKIEIPLVRMSLSKSLFINDTYFNYDYMRVDELRLRHLKKRIWEGIERFFKGNF